MSGTADANTRTGHDVVADVVGVVGVVLAGGQSRRMGRDKALLRLEDGRMLLERTVHVLRTVGLDDVLLSVSSAERTAALREAVPSAAALPVIADDAPNHGPLGGLAAALRARPGRAVLLVACDLPHLDRRALELVVDAFRRGLPSPPLPLRGTPPLLPTAGLPSPPTPLPRSGEGCKGYARRAGEEQGVLRVRAVDIVLPRVGGYDQPLHAVYGPSCLPQVLRLLDAGRLAMSGLLTAPDLSVSVLPEEYFVARGVAPSCFANVNTPDDLAALTLPAPVGG